jgi:hypothetical protein
MIPAPADHYSPQLRTALVLTGTGASGAYHAGVLRAFHEAGVKIDVVAARGIGVVGALFAAVDGAQRLWDDKGFWRSAAVTSFYRWHRLLVVGASAVALAVAVVAIPIAAMAVGLAVFPIDFVLKMIGIGGAPGLVGWYLEHAQAAFAPDGFPTWLPRIVVLLLGTAGVIAVVNAWRSAGSRRQAGAVWWRIMPAPLSSDRIVDHCWRVMWDLLRGAAHLKQPAPSDLVRRYTELLGDNLGQPGFRELLLVVHDLDVHRDLVFALVPESRRRDLIKRPTSEEADARRAEVFDLKGVARDYLADAVAGALSVPGATEPRELTFAPDSYWRGETHRLCDRPASLARVLDELADLGIEQAIVVSACDEPQGPHALARGRIDLRSRVGDYLQSAEAAILRDAVRLASSRIMRIFTVHPDHNAIGPFDFGGSYDDRSDRRHPLIELMDRGYQDGYHQFVEPVVGASGERMGGATVGKGRRPRG